jgi:branched-chain amino acid transport system substrate-binding protein
VIAEVEKALKKRQGADYGGYAGIGYMSGWAFVTLMAEIFGRAAEMGDVFDGPALYKAALTVDNWDSGGVFGGPVSIVNQRVPLGTIYKYNVGEGTIDLDPVAEGIKVT